MLQAILSNGRFATKTVMLLAILLATRAVAAADAATVTAEQLKSFDWWVAAAQQYAEAVQDAETRSAVFCDLAYVNLHAGDLAGVSTAAAKVTNPQSSVYIHTALAERYHKAGDASACQAELQAARNVVLATEENRTGNFLYSHLIRAYVERDMAEDAKSLAESLPPWWHRDLGLRHVASELAKQGNLKAALEIAKQDVSEKSRDAALAEVAFACAGEGRIEDTQSAIEELSSSEPRDKVFAALAKPLAKAGRLDEAQAAIGKITAPEVKAEAESFFLYEWADKQDPEAIEARLEEATTREEKLGLSKKLIEKLIAAERVDEAEAAIEAMVVAIKDSPRPAAPSKFGEMDDSVAIADAKAKYLPIAQLLAKQGDLAGAKRRIDWAAEPILDLSSTTGLGKGMLVIQLVHTQAEIGDLEGARQSLEEIEEAFTRSMPAGALAAAYAKAGDVPAALEVFAFIEGTSGSRGTYSQKVIQELIASGEIAAAKQVLGEMSNPVDQDSAYRAAGRAMIEAHRGDELYQWLLEMPSDVARASACIGAAEGLRPPRPQGS